MPHTFSTDIIYEDIFILLNLCFASKAFCKEYNIAYYSEDDTEFNWDYYKGYLKYLVSEKLISCAIKIRMLHDLAIAREEEFEYSNLDKECCEGLEIGRYPTSNEQLSIREACNKIIHATEVTMIWEEIQPSEKKTKSKGKLFEYWNGNIMLEGTKSNNLWKLELFVRDFCIALGRLNAEFEDIIDWHHIYKYDR